MSVWKTPCYRDDAAEYVSRYIGRDAAHSDFALGFLNFDVGDPGEFVLPNGMAQGNLKKHVERTKVDWRRFYPQSRSLQPKYLDHFCTKFDQCRFGLNAVYKLGNNILLRKGFQGCEQDPDRDTTISLLAAGLAVCGRSPKDGKDKIKLFEAAYTSGYEWSRNRLVDLVKAKAHWRNRAYQSEAMQAAVLESEHPQVPKAVTGGWYNWDLYAFPGALIICGFHSNFLLLNKDLDRLEKYVLGLGKAALYPVCYGNADDKRRKLLISKFGEMCDLVIRTTGQEQRGNEVARAFDVALSIAIAKMVVPDDNRCIQEQMAKWAKEDLGGILDLNSYLNALRGLGQKELLEVCHVYKCLPQPDFDIYGAANRQLTMYRENQSQALEDGAADGEVFEGIIKYHKFLMIQAFHKLHGRLPGHIKEGVDEDQPDWVRAYPKVQPSEVDPDLTDLINLEGEFVYNSRSTDILDLVKDKAICPKMVSSLENEADLMRIPKKEKVQLLDILERSVPVNLQTLDFKGVNFETKADDKPEAKKPNGRWFMAAHSDLRLVLSQYEEGVARYAKVAPGSVVGMPREKYQKHMDENTTPNLNDPYHRDLFISFDIKKFSPYLPVRVHQALDNQWAEAFGDTRIKDYSMALTEGKLHYIKKGIHHSFGKLGVDFEGWAGRKLTMYHCAVMGYAVRTLRKDGVVGSSNRLATLIDDGLLRLRVKSDNYLENREEALRVIEAIYSKGALRISWDKTFVSEKYAVFLNQHRYLGRSVTPGSRAFLKMCNRADTDIRSIGADISELEATSMGALSAGAPIGVTYFMYQIEFLDILRRWGLNYSKFKRGLPIMLYLPHQLGGLGMVSVKALATSAAYDHLVEGLGCLKMLGLRYKQYRVPINDILNSVELRPGNCVVDPSNVRCAGDKIRMDRVRNKLRENVAKLVSKPGMSAILPLVYIQNIDFLEEQIRNGARVPGPLRQSLHDMDLGAALDRILSKFLYARSLKELLSNRDINRVRNAYRREAVKVVGRVME